MPYCFWRSSVKFQGQFLPKLGVSRLKNRQFGSSLSKITRPVAAIKSLRFALFAYITCSQTFSFLATITFGSCWFVLLTPVFTKIMKCPYTVFEIAWWTGARDQQKQCRSSKTPVYAGPKDQQLVLFFFKFTLPKYCSKHISNFKTV